MERRIRHYESSLLSNDLRPVEGHVQGPVDVKKQRPSQKPKSRVHLLRKANGRTLVLSPPCLPYELASDSNAQFRIRIRETPMVSFLRGERTRIKVSGFESR